MSPFQAPPFFHESDPIAGLRLLQSAYVLSLLKKHFGIDLAEEASASMRSEAAIVLRIDHGLKNSKHVHTEGERAFEATCTIMNERGKILGLYHGGTGLHELKACLVLLRNRIERMGKVGKPLHAALLVPACRSCSCTTARLRMQLMCGVARYRW